MCSAELARLTGHAPTTLARYKAGKRVPTKVFLLDLLDKAPKVGFTFDQIAPKLGHRWAGSRDPQRYDTFAEYFAAIRVIERRNRDQLAIKLGITAEDVKEIEHGVLPDPQVVKRFAKVFLRPQFSYNDVVAAFAQLRPDQEAAELRDRFLTFQHLPKGDPTRRAMEDAIIEECVPMAKRIARSVAYGLHHPELEEEIWGEGLVVAVRDHDPRRGYLPAYLRARIKGLARGILWSRMQSGVSTVLRDYGLMVREADEFLTKDFGRSPTEAEIAQYLDIAPAKVSEITQAVLARHAAVSENLDFLLQHAVDIGFANEPWAGTENMLARRFRDLPEEDAELLFLHYHDRIPVPEIAEITGATEDDVAARLRWAIACLRSELG